MTTFFSDYKIVDIPVSTDGHFSKTIYIHGQQDLYLRLNNDAITIFVVPGDTLSLEWDTQNFKQTFQIDSHNPERQQELNLMLHLDQKFRQPFLQLSNQIYDKDLTDSAKYKRANKLFDQEIKVVTNHPATGNTRRIICDIFYQYANTLYLAQLFKRYHSSYYLSLDDAIPDSLKKFTGLVKPNYLDQYNFYCSPNYRNFIYTYVSTFLPFGAYYNSSEHSSHSASFLDRKCYAGLAFLSGRFIKAWYLSKVIIDGFGQFPFRVCKEAYQKFLPFIETPLFKDSLREFYTAMQRLKPGVIAPGFTLKNIDGKEVSLSDFKGKVVYIDFWGVYCGACRSDIKGPIPKLHKKYENKNVVFLNICVDVNRELWKKGVQQLHVEGVNLLAEGWNKNPVCQDYNINGIPHYVLIDQEGKIADNNASRPRQLLPNWKNEIDKLLK